MKKGFTLIEVMVALVMVMVCVLAVAKLSVLAVQSKAYGEHLTRATMLGQAGILSLQALKETSPEILEGWHQDPLNPLSHDGMEFYRFWMVTQRPLGKEVTLYVAWHDRHGGRARGFGSLEGLMASPCPRIDLREFLVQE